jgi:NAD+ synthase (glutamine-hydrolysing)
MKIALVQVNPKVGDFERNVNLVLDRARQASAAGAEVALFPEMVLCGYPPLDLLSFPSFVDANTKALESLARNLPPELLTLVGVVTPVDRGSGDFAWEKGLENSVAALAGGRVVFQQAKTLLPTYDVFDERRYFRSATSRRVFEWKGVKIGIPICEDLWWEASLDAGLSQGNPYGIDPVAELADLGADLILSPSASPFYPGKRAVRIELMASVGRRFGIPVLYVNQVGGNDALVFDGGPLVTDKKGSLVVQGPSFTEGIVYWDSDSDLPAQPIDEEPIRDLYHGLVLGLRDYVVKSGFRKVHLGLSGGIDSALVAVLAAEALGRENVRGLGMPSRYSSGGSVDDARALAGRLGIRFDVVSIEAPFGAFLSALGPLFEGSPEDVTEENIQARIRGVYLMALSNKTGSMLLTTGNKSELATGYCTLYGDMAGGLGVIGDVFKTEVYALAAWINRDQEVIPWNTIRKPPSAELRPGQTDQDSLPPYETLDRILKAYILEQKSATEIAACGEDPAVVRRVLKLTASAEYKRWQAPPVLKVSPVSFGIGRRLPLVRNLFELGADPVAGPRTSR